MATFSLWLFLWWGELRQGLTRFYGVNVATGDGWRPLELLGSLRRYVQKDGGGGLGED